MRGVTDVRLAIRDEGNYVVFYLARQATMDGAVEVARFSKRLLESDRAFYETQVLLFQTWFRKELREHGVSDFDLTTGPAPEHEGVGKA